MFPITEGRVKSTYVDYEGNEQCIPDPSLQQMEGVKIVVDGVPVNQ
ncbi:MAG: hypothetical protein NVS1B10_08240 [Candidatus Saccharimonadales bacterium]